MEELFNYQPDIVGEFKEFVSTQIPIPNPFPNVSTTAGPFSGRVIGITSASHSDMENVLEVCYHVLYAYFFSIIYRNYLVFFIYIC